MCIYAYRYAHTRKSDNKSDMITYHNETGDAIYNMLRHTNTCF